MDRECLFYSKIGTCRHGTNCAKVHTPPNHSRVVLLEGFLPTDERDYTAVAEDILLEAAKLGYPVDILMSSNAAPHLKGNVYVMMDSTSDADALVADFGSRWYAQRPVKASLCPAYDLRAPRCREGSSCSRGDSCNYVHSRSLNDKRIDAILDIVSGAARGSMPVSSM